MKKLLSFLMLLTLMPLAALAARTNVRVSLNSNPQVYSWESTNFSEGIPSVWIVGITDPTTGADLSSSIKKTDIAPLIKMTYGGKDVTDASVIWGNNILYDTPQTVTFTTRSVAANASDYNVQIDNTTITAAFKIIPTDITGFTLPAVRNVQTGGTWLTIQNNSKYTYDGTAKEPVANGNTFVVPADFTTWVAADGNKYHNTTTLVPGKDVEYDYTPSNGKGGTYTTYNIYSNGVETKDVQVDAILSVPNDKDHSKFYGSIKYLNYQIKQRDINNLVLAGTDAPTYRGDNVRPTNFSVTDPNLPGEDYRNLGGLESQVLSNVTTLAAIFGTEKREKIDYTINWVDENVNFNNDASAKISVLAATPNSNYTGTYDMTKANHLVAYNINRANIYVLPVGHVDFGVSGPVKDEYIDSLVFYDASNRVYLDATHKSYNTGNSNVSQSPYPTTVNLYDNNGLGDFEISDYIYKLNVDTKRAGWAQVDVTPKTSPKYLGNALENYQVVATEGGFFLNSYDHSGYLHIEPLDIRIKDAATDTVKWYGKTVEGDTISGRFGTEALEKGQNAIFAYYNNGELNKKETMPTIDHIKLIVDTKYGKDVISTLWSDTLKEGKDYTVEIKQKPQKQSQLDWNAVNIGDTLIVTYTGKGNYVFSQTLVLPVLARPVNVAFKKQELRYNATGTHEWGNGDVLFRSLASSVAAHGDSFPADGQNTPNPSLKGYEGYMLTLHYVKLDEGPKYPIEKDDRTLEGDLTTGKRLDVGKYLVTPKITFTKDAETYTFNIKPDTLTVLFDTAVVKPLAVVTQYGKKVALTSQLVAYDNVNNFNETKFNPGNTINKKENLIDVLSLRDSTNLLQVGVYDREGTVGNKNVNPAKDTLNVYNLSTTQSDKTLGDKTLQAGTYVLKIIYPVKHNDNLTYLTNDAHKDPNFCTNVNHYIRVKNHILVVDTAHLVVNPYPLALKPADQDVTIGYDINRDSVKYVKIVNNRTDDPWPYHQTISDVHASLHVGEANAEHKDDPNYYSYNVNKFDVISLTWNNPNYDVIADTAKVWWRQAAKFYLYGSDEITPNEHNTDYLSDWKRIELNKNLKFKTVVWYPNRSARKWEANKWNTVVLPFDIVVPDLSAGLHYGVVNILGDATATSANFKLNVLDTIKANTPFLVKTYKDIPVDEAIEFTRADGKDFTIVRPDSSLCVQTAGNSKFVGTYKTVTITDTDNYVRFMTGTSQNWSYVPANTGYTWNVIPEAAYFVLPSNASAKDFTFYMQEADGTTTAIKAINGTAENTVDNNAEGWYNLGGAKLNAQPTQKGVYIHNGKKVVVK